MKNMTDAEKHEWCQKRGYPSAVFIYPWLYHAAERAGFDMRQYVMIKPIPETA